MDTSERRGALLFLVTVTGLGAVAAGNTPLLLWSVVSARIEQTPDDFSTTTRSWERNS